MSLNGLVVMTPSSVSYSGTSASISNDGSVIFSGISSYLRLDGVFTSDYDNYMVVLHVAGSSSDGLLKIRLRSGGGDFESGYDVQHLQSGDLNQRGLISQTTEGYLGKYGSGTKVSGTCAYIFGPYLTQETIIRVNASFNGSSNTNLFDSSTVHTGPYSCDGFTIWPNAGASNNGRVVVYGFNQ